MAKVIPPQIRFLQAARVRSNDVYLSQPYQGNWNDYTWEETKKQVMSMAAYLQEKGLKPGDKVAIISKNCAHWIMSDLAIMMAGCVSVPLYPTISADIIEYVLQHSEAKVAFVGKLDDWGSQKSGVPSDIHTISFPFWKEDCEAHWDDIVQATSPLEHAVEVQPDDWMTIIYTSGTTGLPKGVIHSYSTLPFAVANGIAVLDRLQIGKERYFSYLPLAHIAERMLVEMGSLYTEGRIYFTESLDTFAGDLKMVQPTVFLAVPRIWTKFQLGILEKMPQERLNLLLSIPIVKNIIKKKIKENLGLSKARYILSGAAPFPVSTNLWFEKLGIEIGEAYAMTENSAYSHITRPDARKPGYVGQLLPHVKARIAENGELQTKSQANMVGYYKEPEMTQEVITEDGYLRTGDEGVIDSDGFLKITGRIKDIFKTDKGKYVAPTPIETDLSKNTMIEQVCVVGANLPQTMALIVLSEEAQSLDYKAVEKSILGTVKSVNKNIDRHEQMTKVVIMREAWTTENNLLTPTLKVKRNVLEKKYEDQYLDWYNHENPVVWLKAN